MRYLYFVMILLVISAGCKDRISTRKKIPSGITGKETMAKILADIHIAESMVPNTGKNDSNAKKLNILYFVIFKKYGITEQQFRRSMDYYTRNPDVLAEVYDMSTEILNTRKVEWGYIFHLLSSVFVTKISVCNEYPKIKCYCTLILSRYRLYQFVRDLLKNLELHLYLILAIVLSHLLPNCQF